MYKSVWVENFRGIQRLSVGDLGRLNLFVGPNNAGKTSLLEALWLLQSPGNPTTTLVLSIYRGFNPQIQSPNLTWPTLFYDLDLDRQIVIGGTKLDGTAEKLTISHANDWPEEAETTSNGTVAAASMAIVNPSVVTPETLYFDYREGDHPSLRSSFSVGLGRVGVSPRSDLIALRSVFLAARQRLTAEDLATRFTTVQDVKGTEALVESLSILQPGLRHLSIGYRAADGGTPQVQLRVHIEGLTNPIPIQVLGEGVSRLTEILLSVSSLRDSVLFVDEVENGLYYRNLEDTWRAIDRASREAHVQVFATTHSDECVQAAVRATDGESAADFRLFRLDPSVDGIDVVAYDHANASAVFAFNLEFR